MLHVDKDKTHVDVITLMLHVDINYLVRSGQKCATIIFRKLSLQVHWNNPERRSDYQDSSGMTLYFTPNLRANDAAILMIGQTYLHIPPGKDRHTESAVCNREDTRTLFAGPIHVFRALNHMHYLGECIDGVYDLVKHITCKDSKVHGNRSRFILT